MRFKIVHDLPGRIRVRCGRDAFSKDESYSIVKTLEDLNFVYSAEASVANGSILVLYEKEKRARVLEQLTALKARELVLVPQGERNQARDITTDFQRKLAVMVGRRYLMKWLVPAPIRTALTLLRAYKFMKLGLRSLEKGKLDVKVLEATSIAVSLVQRDTNTAASIMFLLSLSDLLEDYTRKKASNELTESLRINVDFAWLQEGSTLRPVAISDLKLGDQILVRTGSMIPIDGTVCDGEAMVNESSMTGEPLAVRKNEDSTVFAGTVVEEGSLVIRVTALSNETRINKIIDLIHHSESLKAKIQGKAETLADAIVPFSFLLSGLTFLLTRNLTKAISVLMVDYSCALKLSTPITIISAMREASSHKIVVKGGKHLEAYAKADIIIFDKTGTLTVASPQVEKVIPCGSYTREEVLRTAACMEEHFPHSVARAIVRKAQEENLNHEEEHAEVEYLVAHGIATSLHGKRTLIGSYHFIFEDEQVPLTEEDKKLIHQESDDNSVVYLAIGGQLAGFLCIEDPVRGGTKEILGSLRELGIEQIIMLTGDSEKAANKVAQELGIDSYYAQILPEDKAAIVESLKQAGHRVIMVGDGINDSPALAAADVSVSMKDSSDIAKEVADITLLASHLGELVTLRRLSMNMMRRINYNYGAILGFNTSLLLLGMGGIITPATSALLHNLSTMGISAASMKPLLPKPSEEA
ncbi:heavy metal translocating P-type ATPase [Aminipila butyrica]|uniref:Cd(2+)-exporting ATPase n=1 Tax=Aminipila butyrica TaxID=433296 RepID=A0A858BYB6_9FIRM|nr:heavy metal translocating P-type ATPase [Aminipila butyrica]QIB70452.1 heavy metal translocating P-type ATPase [Aminipila butyrica]